MYSAPRPEPIDIRLVFRAYALLAGLGGFILASWGPLWLGVHLPGQPFGRAALIRVFGAILVGAACCAAGFGALDDRIALRRGLFWFASGHAVVALMVVLQQLGPWGEGTATWTGHLLLSAGVILWCFWIESASRRSVLTGLFANIGPQTTQDLRSQYERQIRQAARQEERNRLARDLHDSIKQQIFVIQTSAATVQARFDDDRSGARHALEQIRASAREAATEMQAMLDQMHAAPLENAGLVETLKKQCEALGFRTGARVEFRLGDLPPNAALSPGAHEAILRVAQEALANIGRHARADNVRVSLGSVHNLVKLTIVDDGAGFDPNQERRGLGIANMRARAGEFGGTFEIASRPGGGTSVEFSIPCAAADTPHPRLYLRNAAMWGALLVAPPAVLVLIGHWAVPGGTMVSVLAAVGLLRNLSAYRRLRGRQ